jgi:hypothetical protein
MVRATASNEAFESLDSEACPFALPATVTVVDEAFFEDRRNVVVNEVMNDSIPEISGENLPFYWVVLNEVNASSDLVFSGKKLMVELN